MKKISLILLGFLTVINIYAEEQTIQNMDKLDALDQQSKEFFKAITGLEKDYLEEQVNAIKNKKVEQNINPNMPNQPQVMMKEEPKLSQEDYEKNVFSHQNEMARLTTDFTRTKKLKDLKIKSMYSFNGKDYVVLELIDETNANRQATVKTELSANIEGRYVEGDSVLGHQIIDINTRTKSVELYKKLDEEYGYKIYLSNYGISVSELVKTPKAESEKKVENKKVKEEIKSTPKEEQTSVKKVFEQVQTDANKVVNKEKSTSSCSFRVLKQNLNVRNSPEGNAQILRVLKLNDEFSIKQRNNDWVEIDTIHKKISGDVMDVSTQNNWVQITDGSASALDKTCM